MTEVHFGSKSNFLISEDHVNQVVPPLIPCEWVDPLTGVPVESKMKKLLGEGSVNCVRLVGNLEDCRNRYVPDNDGFCTACIATSTGSTLNRKRRLADPSQQICTAAPLGCTKFLPSTAGSNQVFCRLCLRHPCFPGSDGAGCRQPLKGIPRQMILSLENGTL